MYQEDSAFIEFFHLDYAGATFGPAVARKLMADFDAWKERASKVMENGGKRRRARVCLRRRVQSRLPGAAQLLRARDAGWRCAAVQESCLGLRLTPRSCSAWLQARYVAIHERVLVHPTLVLLCALRLT